MKAMTYHGPADVRYETKDTGRGVETLSPGDRVAVPFNISCGRCSYCRRELFGMCENSNPNSEIARCPTDWVIAVDHVEERLAFAREYNGRSGAGGGKAGRTP